MRTLGMVVFVLSLISGAAFAGTPLDGLTIVSEPSNDLYQCVLDYGAEVQHFETLSTALAKAAPGSGVLILAAGYPQARTLIGTSDWEQIERKELRVYIEYPEQLGNTPTESPKHIRWERAVVSSDAFGSELQQGRILAIHDCHYVPLSTEDADIVVARVAGFDTAVFGIPEDAEPILTEVDGVLVSTTKLSQFITGRYAPVEAWKSIWGAILQRIAGTEEPIVLEWEPHVQPTYAADEKASRKMERKAARRGTDWFFNARLFPAASWPEENRHYMGKVGDKNRVGPAPDPSWEIGDGSFGMIEGVNSTIRFDGTQDMRWWWRHDCMAESAMALAFDGTVQGQRRSKMTAENLNRFIYEESPVTQGPRGDKNSDSYGLLSWNISDEFNWGTFYGDDNARGLLALMASSALLEEDRWDEVLLRGIMANFRTAGQLGFRSKGRIDMAQLHGNGWQHYFEQKDQYLSAHFESYIWATYLWAYAQTGYTPLLERSKTALTMMMEGYPNEWHWCNGLQQERARLLLPLSWLVRVEDTPQHRAWLKQIATDMVAHQVACGAIREEVGTVGKGRYGPPKSNAAYGTDEAPLIQANGDPLVDLLYTTNFVFLGLHEAAAATGDPFYTEAEDKLAEFLCRIQVKSEEHPQLDGAWFRAFDYNRWDYWASNADLGWGAWSVESGWTCGWIIAVLNLRQMESSLWELTEDSNAERHMPKVLEQLFGDYTPPVPPTPIRHDALGAEVVHMTIPADSYAHGDLVDGLRGTMDHQDPEWLGFWGQDFEAIIDLGESKEVKHLGMHFLRSHKVGIMEPVRVETSISVDGVNFSAPCLTDGAQAVEFLPNKKSYYLCAPISDTARYIRVKAKNMGVLPEWHSHAGQKAWLFIDEILVNPVKE